MTRIAYVTDLHLGAPQSRKRVDSLGNKMAKLPAHTLGLCVTGDTFTLIGAPAWKPLIDGPLTDNEINERWETSQRLVDEWAPQIKSFLPKGLPVYFIPGNADYFASVYLAGEYGAHHKFQCIDGRVVSEGLPFNLMGVGGITPNDPDAANILAHNPWYGGVLSAKDLNQYLTDLLTYTTSWRTEDWSKAILMTHLPAFGQVDLYKGQNQGSSAILNFIRATQPLLHLAGHVHDGPFNGEQYNPCSVIDNLTVSVNAGGGQQHDVETGVRLLSIDVGALIMARNAGRVKAAVADAVKVI